MTFDVKMAKQWLLDMSLLAVLNLVAALSQCLFSHKRGCGSSGHMVTCG